MSKKIRQSNKSSKSRTAKRSTKAKLTPKNKKRKSGVPAKRSVRTRDAVHWNARRNEYVQIDIPRERLPLRPGDFELSDSQGRQKTDFEVGDSLMISLQGLIPNRSYEIGLLDDRGEETLSVSLLCNRFGVIAPTVLWPDIGIGFPEKGGRFAFKTFEEAFSAMGGKSFVLEVRDRYADAPDKPRIVRTGRFTVATSMSQKRLYSASESGVLQRGLLVGRDELRVQGRNFKPGSLVDIYLVQRHNWKVGEAIVPIQNSDGTEVVSTVTLAPDQRDFHVLLWPREQLIPGSYDIIAREAIPHEYLRHQRILRDSDVVSERFITSLVVRDDLFHYKPIQQGCVMATKEIAAKMLWGVPEEILYTNNFPKGTDVWASLDPAGLMPAAIGKKVHYYVIPHKTASDWQISSSAAGIPGTGAEIVTTSSCVNGNAALVWSNPQQAGQYDLVVDFGNNDPNPANFLTDESFDPPLDMIDGYLNVGFYVTDDPSVAGSFLVGQTSFNDPAVTIPATGVWGPGGITVGDTPSGTLSLPMVAEVRYPATMSGMNAPVSPAQSNYPVVVIMHGQHMTADPSYLGYNYLLDHLASHGFIAMSIDCNAINDIGGFQDTRGRAILEHLALLQSKDTAPGLFQGKIDMTRIAIMGHSRGGDGVVQAEMFNQGLGLGWNIRAVIALAPTDFSGTSPTPLNLATSTFLCIYGSNDGDVWGGSVPSAAYTGTGFRFYDRATVEKAMIFIYGATHNRFNTVWLTESKVDATSPKILSVAQHQTLLKGYMTAFLQGHLQNRPEQLDYFSGELKIPQASTVSTYAQYRPTARLTMDDFESAPAVNQNALGGMVTSTNLLFAPEEDTIVTLDMRSPHQTRCVEINWNAATARYQSEIPLAQRDVSMRKFLSFRVTQFVGTPLNPMNQSQDFHVRLSTAGGGNSRAVRAGYFGAVPFPYKPEYVMNHDSDEDPNTKSAMTTIRIPLYAWTIKCLNVPIVDLTNVESVAFEFGYRPKGDIIIDDIEFTD